MNFKFVQLEVKTERDEIKLRKVTVFFCVFILIVLISLNCYAKYVIESNIEVATIKIDGERPIIELVEIENSNNKYPQYASERHTIKAKIKVIEKNIQRNNFDKNRIKIIVGENAIVPQIYQIRRIRKDSTSITYEITLNKILGDGRLKIKVPENTIIDIGNQTNEEMLFDTGINIDNTSPITSFYQKQIDDGKIKAEITTNEEVQELNAWNINENKNVITKDFECNVTYPLKVYDYAENYTELVVGVTKATNIIMKYGAISENKNWSFGQGNGDTAGKESIIYNPNNRTEAISFYTEGNIKDDFVQLQAYAHTYWGEGKKGNCYTYEIWYNSGYNPSPSEYFSLKNGNIINLNGKYSLLIGRNSNE